MRIRRPRLRPDLVTAAQLQLAEARAAQAEEDARALMVIVALSRWNTGRLGLRGDRLLPRPALSATGWAAEQTAVARYAKADVIPLPPRRTS